MKKITDPTEEILRLLKVRLKKVELKESASEVEKNAKSKKHKLSWEIYNLNNQIDELMKKHFVK